MTALQIIEAKYEKLFIALFDSMDWNGYLTLMRLKQNEIDQLNQTKTSNGK